jgi:hypothetical protein
LKPCLQDFTVHEHKVHPEILVLSELDFARAICVEHHESYFALLLFSTVERKILVNEVVLQHDEFQMIRSQASTSILIRPKFVSYSNDNVKNAL